MSMQAPRKGEQGKPDDAQRRSSAERVPLRGLFCVYGWTGVLMVAAFLLSGVWTLTLAVIQLAPTQVANVVMGTSSLDDGDFWTLQKASDGLAATAAALLVVFAMGYFSLVVMMVRTSGGFCALRCRRERRCVEVRPGDVVVGQSSAPESVRRREWNPLASVAKIHVSLVERFWIWKYMAEVVTSHDTPAFAIPKLLLQTTILFRYLREGFPLTTIIFYASLLVLNWMISTYCAMVHLVDPRARLVRIFYSFDLFFAVFAPLQAILYAYNDFYFDNAEFATRMETLSPGSFDYIARLFADPKEVSHFRAAFRSLQLSSVSSLGVKAVLNVFTIRKWQRTIRYLGRRHSVSEPTISTTQNRKIGRASRLLASLFFAMGVALFIYTIVAVVSSVHVCKRFVHCQAPSYRWNVGVDVCSCSVFVDRQTYVKTFDEWEHPIDTRENLAVLAASGDLKVIQIINRRLSTLPDELRSCRGLEQLILIYTKTTTFPDWAREFPDLEYLHIEGDLSATQLDAFPRDLFHEMPKLAFLHLGSLRHIPFIPDLNRQSHLKYVTLALLHSVTSFPSLDALARLERVVIVDATHVPTLPSFANLQNLKALIIGGRNAVCCNGYLTGICDITDFSCRDRTANGEPRVDCVEQRMSQSDRVVVAAVGVSICANAHAVDLGEMAATRESTDEACGGAMYKRCELHGVSGMCYPTRMKAIQCELNPGYEALRQLQIERDVGDACDPIVEKWLGCRAKSVP